LVDRKILDISVTTAVLVVKLKLKFGMSCSFRLFFVTVSTDDVVYRAVGLENYWDWYSDDLEQGGLQ
jgi:hypothetical protein